MHRRAFCQGSVAAGVSTAFYGFRNAHADIPASVATVTGSGEPVSIKRAAIVELRDALAGKLYLPTDPNYDDVRKVWNGMIDKRPGLIVQCVDDNDVANAVVFAAEHELLLAVRGGGHSYPGKSVCDGGLMIDLAPMHAVSIDQQARVATVQGGALLGQLDGASLKHKLATTTGIISHTGVGGFTLGGGMGRIDRLCGLAVDNLLAATVVTASGRILRASAEENADLYWALRGGGGNFGAVTSMDLRLHPFDEQVYGGTVSWSFDHAHDVLELYAEQIAKLPVAANVEPGFSAYDGERYVYVTICVSGDDAIAREVCQRFEKVAKPVNGEFGPRSYSAMQTGGDEYYAHGRLNYLKSGLLLELTPSLIDTMIENFEGDFLPDVWFQHLGGAISQVAPDATAYPHRDAIANLGISSVWDDDADSANYVAEVRRYHAALAPHMKGFYTNLNEDTESRTHGNFGLNYPRLVDIKNRFDPDNLFRLNANIQPTA